MAAAHLWKVHLPVMDDDIRNCRYCMELTRSSNIYLEHNPDSGTEGDSPVYYALTLIRSHDGKAVLHTLDLGSLKAHNLC